MLIDLDYQPTEEEKVKAKQTDKIYYETLFQLYAKRFTHGENPIYAWEVYKICRSNSLPLPEWVMKYFDEVASNLMAPLHTKEGAKDLFFHKADKKRIGIFLQKALKMDKKGGGDVYKRYTNIEKNLGPIWKLNKLLEKGMTLEDAKTEISSETDMPEDTLHKLYYQYKNILTKS
jgi:hypothetical protein